MNADKLKIEFVRDYEKEYFIAPKTNYLNYYPWDTQYEEGVYPRVMFSKKEPMCIIKQKNKDLWLYNNINKFYFGKLKCIKNGFDILPPQLFWIEYIKDNTFILYKTVKFGITDKYYLVYRETGDKIYMNWTTNIRDATIFSTQNDVRWNEYHSDLVGTEKRF